MTYAPSLLVEADAAPNEAKPEQQNTRNDERSEEPKKQVSRLHVLHEKVCAEEREALSEVQNHGRGNDHKHVP